MNWGVVLTSFLFAIAIPKPGTQMTFSRFVTLLIILLLYGGACATMQS